MLWQVLTLSSNSLFSFTDNWWINMVCVKGEMVEHIKKGRFKIGEGKGSLLTVGMLF